MSSRLLPVLFGALAFGLYGCPDEVDPPDAGSMDTGVRDGGVSMDASADAGEAVPDAGTPDSGEVPDAGTPDTGVTPDAGNPQSISFLHTNDEHSHFLGHGPNVDDFPTMSSDPSILGGIYRRAAVLETLEDAAEADGDPVVKVSAGDVPMGSLFHIGNLITSPDYIAQSILGYDVMTLGNHEFDFGPGVLAGMIAEGSLSATGSMQELRIPLVVSNIRFSMSSSDDDELAAFYGADRPIRRTWIRNFGDVTVGFVGVVGLDAALVAPFKTPVNFSLAVDESTTCTADSECTTGLCIPPAADPVATTGSCAIDPSGFDFATNFPALVADVAGAVAEVRAQGVDLVVAVSHSGVDEREVNTLQMMGMGLENATRSEEILLARGVDQALAAANVPGIDLIVGGHSHSELQAPLEVPNDASGITTYVVQAGQYGEWVGRVRLTRDDVTLPWTLDTTNTGLTKVDGSIDTTRVDRFFLDALVFGVMDALEQTPIAQAGDGLVFPGEQCDTDGSGGLVGPGNMQCANVLPGSMGNLGCHPNRQLDFSGCTLPLSKNVCGNGFPEPPEQCDGTTIPVGCTDIGYTGGTVACAGNCTLDVSGCTVRFPSLLESALNFARPQDEAEIIYDGNRGDLFLHTLGSAGFDVGGRQVSNESNIVNLVADANRAISNELGDFGFDKEPNVDVALVANGIIRDGLYAGATGALTLADLFRVVPLGVSPQENTPGFTLTDFYLTAAELKVVLEIGVGTGFDSDAFWLGVSGARVEYDPSRPAFDAANPTTTGRVTKIELMVEGMDWSDTDGFHITIFDAANGGFEDPNELLHISSNLYLTLFAGGFGLCPRTVGGQPHPACAPCTMNSECTAPGSVCDTAAGQCAGGEPPAFSMRTQTLIAGGFRQEIKEFLALTSYVRRMQGDALPTNYSDPVPRRLCCVGPACPTDGSRTCPVIAD